MTTEKIHRLTPSHLSPRPVDAVLCAWITDADVQAIRTLDGDESLMIGTKVIPLTSAQAHPTQMVINLCMLGRRDRSAAIKRLLAL